MTSLAKNIKQLLIIDSQVKNWQSLVNNVTDAVILVLDSKSDGLTQIAKAVTDYSGLDAIHIISHGSVGSLLLGSTTVNSDNLSNYASQLALIGHALKDTGDVLLYGCDVAQGETGSAFINQFAALTGADVAASNDLTGATTLGGDWILEKTVGTVETSALQSSYSDVLALPTAFQLFNSLLTPEEKLVAGGEQAGMIRTMANFAKAAYNLIHSGATEYVDINDNSPHATEAYNDVINHNWTPLNLLSAPPILDRGAIQYGMLNDGFYVNGNAAACVARCGDAIVLSFRGTNDNGKDGVVNLYDPNNAIHPDVNQWEKMYNHYALLKPLIDTFDAYVVANGISKVYVTGHSMGGAMAIEYMSHHLGSQYQAVSFGAPPYTGSTTLGVPNRTEYAADNRITQIEILQDPVPMAHEIGIDQGRPGNVIDFGGNQTMDTPDNIPVPWPLPDYLARTANHSMDYYRQITDSVDADSWTRILAETGTQTVLLGGQQVTGTDNFIVDGQLSGTNTSINSGSDYLVAPSINFKTIYGGKGNDTLVAGANNTLLLGGVGNDMLQGNVGNDKLIGGTGDDSLNGGTGADTLVGGLGNDNYYIDNVGDVVTENAGEGFDAVYLSLASYTLTANIEALILTGTAVSGLGNALNNIIYGNTANNSLNGGAGNDILNGGAGLDTLIGGTGNDTYYVDNVGDMVIENAGEGTDGVWSSLNNYTLANNVESLGLLAGALNGTGNAGDNYMLGNSADNILNGGTGVDTLVGGLGNDSYYIDNVGDVVTENTSAGFDAVYSSLASYTLTANVEALILTGTAVSGFGNALNNIIYGNTANNNLDGGAGSDLINGGAGDDTLDGGVSDIYNSGVTDTLNGEVGNDTFLSRGFYGAGIYTGGTGIDLLDFSQADSYTAGRRSAEGAGVSVNLAVGTASTYYRVAGNFTWADANGKIAVATIENVRGTAQGDRLIGDSNANVLEGSAGNDVLNGGTGADTLIGGTGNDTYYVDNVSDVVTENALEGKDGVWSSLSDYILTANIESFGLLAGALNGTGNAENNYILGNTANNSLTGGEGADTLVGGLGKDTYNLTETIAATDTLGIATGDSVVNNYDVANNFKLGTGSSPTSVGVDRLDLVNTFIAANGIGNSADVGTGANAISSHSINNGIISFDSLGAYDAPVAVTTATNLANVFSYLQANVTGGNTVAFIANTNNTYVFQDGGMTDTLVELVGVIANSVNTSGLATNAVWII